MFRSKGREMMDRLVGKVALVTGASRGIGKAIALRLAGDGAAVIVNYAANRAAAEAVVGEIQQGGCEAIAVGADVGKLDEVARLADAAHERFGHVDILVHNAGVTLDHPRLEAITPELFDEMFNLSTKGPLFLTQRIVAKMPDNGRIIGISSASTQRKIPGLALYTGARSAMEAMLRVLAAELAPRGITANTVSPGAVETDLFAHNSNLRQEDLLRLVPMGRFGRPQDIADVVAFIASEEARWLTGLNIAATGGA
jgi:3-oxoacyl-[acyl-carrier protein] reductase